MSDDLPKVLRACHRPPDLAKLMDDAADEIERLRQCLEALAWHPAHRGTAMGRRALEALGYPPEINLRACRKCGGKMRQSKALARTFTAGTPDFPGDTHVSTFSAGGPGRIIDCMKCEACGWSVTKGDGDERMATD